MLLVFSVSNRDNKIIDYFEKSNMQKPHFNALYGTLLKFVRFTGSTYCLFDYICNSPKNGSTELKPVEPFFIDQGRSPDGGFFLFI
jgi:hypothetical protein